MVFLQVIGLGVLCGILANLFCRAMHLGGQTLRQSLQPLSAGRIGRRAGGSPLPDGGQRRLQRQPSMQVIVAALAGSAVPWAFVLKIVFTVLTLGAGFKGGEIVPCFFVGATFGCTVAPLIGMNPGFGAALGLVAVFCGVTNSPMTSILLGYELFGGQGVALMALGPL